MTGSPDNRQRASSMSRMNCWIFLRRCVRLWVLRFFSTSSISAGHRFITSDGDPSGVVVINSSSVCNCDASSIVSSISIASGARYGGGSLSIGIAGTSACSLPLFTSMMRPEFSPKYAAMWCCLSPRSSIPLTSDACSLVNISVSLCLCVRFRAPRVPPQARTTGKQLDALQGGEITVDQLGERCRLRAMPSHVARDDRINLLAWCGRRYTASRADQQQLMAVAEPVARPYAVLQPDAVALVGKAPCRHHLERLR